ncbi:hypothetical protein GCM10009788_53670 [Nocardioides humi]|uniref:Uncharacterized protein n=1 Tax=Nocardioides humi TaxID=449461 RepID=A0ABN2BR38_9ACTN
MPSGDDLLRWYVCQRKRTYSTEDAALTWLSRTGRRQWLVYLCPHCSCWHVGRPMGHPPNSVTRRNARKAWRRLEAHTRTEHAEAA